MSRTFVATIAPELQFELPDAAPSSVRPAHRPTGVCVDATFRTVDLHYTGAHTGRCFNLPADPRVLHAIADALNGIADGIDAH